MRDEEREVALCGSSTRRGEVGVYNTWRGVYVYDLLAMGKDVSAQRRATLQYLPVETFVKMIERLIEPALLRASSTEPLQPGLSPWGPIAAGWLRELDCIAERDC